MSCDICKQEVCTCGEAYRKMTDQSLMYLLIMANQELKNRNKDIKTTIDGIELETYVANDSSVISDRGTFMTKLNNSFDLGNSYKKWLKQHAGEKVIKVMNDLIEDESDTILKFPLILAMYRIADTKEALYCNRLWMLIRASNDIGYLMEYSPDSDVQFPHSVHGVSDLRQALYNVNVRLSSMVPNKSAISKPCRAMISMCSHADYMIYPHVDFIKRTVKFMAAATDYDLLCEIDDHSERDIVDALMQTDRMFTRMWTENFQLISDELL